MEKIYLETYLPLFPGFYETIFAPDGEDMELDNINSERRLLNLIGEVNYDMCKWDYEGYREEVADKCTVAVETLLKSAGLVDRINYQKISSPREYNFANDAIHVKVRMTPPNLACLSQFVVKYWKEFEEYIKENYTSYDGFLSSYSNDATDWMNDTQTFTVFEDNLHQFGSVLEFCCQILIREGGWEDGLDEWLRDQLVNYPIIEALNYNDLTTDHIVDGKIVNEECMLTRHLSNQGFEFLSGYEDCHRLNRTRADGTIFSFKGFWVKGQEVYGVNVSHPALDAYGVKLT
jgi:hypothetical protein